MHRQNYLEPVLGRLSDLAILAPLGRKRQANDPCQLGYGSRGDKRGAEASPPRSWPPLVVTGYQELVPPLL